MAIRAPVSAAPLKHPHGRACFQTRMAHPRPRERGPVEAQFKRNVCAARDCPIRAPVSAAPLKLLFDFSHRFG